MPRTFTIRKTETGWTGTKDWKQHLDELPVGKYIVTAPKPFKTRSLPQNAFYWSVVVPMVFQGLRDAGFEAVRHGEDAHEIMKALFLKVTDEKNGVKIERVKSTTELTTTDFMEYIQFIQAWASDYLNVHIPDPGQQTEIDYHVCQAEYDRQLNATIVSDE